MYHVNATSLETSPPSQFTSFVPSLAVHIRMRRRMFPRCPPGARARYRPRRCSRLPSPLGRYGGRRNGSYLDSCTVRRDGSNGGVWRSGCLASTNIDGMPPDIDDTACISYALMTRSESTAGGTHIRSTAYPGRFGAPRSSLSALPRTSGPDGRLTTKSRLRSVSRLARWAETARSVKLFRPRIIERRRPDTRAGRVRDRRPRSRHCAPLRSSARTCAASLPWRRIPPDR